MHMHTLATTLESSIKPSLDILNDILALFPKCCVFVSFGGASYHNTRVLLLLLRSRAITKKYIITCLPSFYDLDFSRMWAALIATIAFCVLPKSKAWCISLPPTAPRPRFGTRGSYLTMHRASVEDGADRRHFIGSTLAVPLSIVTLPSKTAASQPESKTGASSMVSPAEVARRLGAVPTFTVVDKRG